MIFYIAGKIKDNPNYREQFKTASEYIESLSPENVAINPTLLPDRLKETAYLPICLAMLEQADAICVITIAGCLPPAVLSRGVCAEMSYARYQNKKIYYIYLNDNPCDVVDMRKEESPWQDQEKK